MNDCTNVGSRVCRLTSNNVFKQRINKTLMDPQIVGNHSSPIDNKLVRTTEYPLEITIL